MESLAEFDLVQKYLKLNQTLKVIGGKALKVP